MGDLILSRMFSKTKKKLGRPHHRLWIADNRVLPAALISYCFLIIASKQFLVKDLSSINLQKKIKVLINLFISLTISCIFFLFYFLGLLWISIITWLKKNYAPFIRKKFNYIRCFIISKTNKNIKNFIFSSSLRYAFNYLYFCKLF